MRVNENYPVTFKGKFSKDILKYLPSKVVPALLGLIFIPIITRLFEPNDYGSYVLVVAIVGLLSMIPGSLLGNSIIRFFPVYEEQNKLLSFYNTLIKEMIVCVLLIAVLFFIVIQVFKTNLSLNLYYLLFIGILLFIVTSIFLILLFLLNARQKSLTYTSYSIWKVGAGLTFGVLIVLFLNRGVEGLLWGSIIALIIAIPLLYRSAFGRVSVWKGAFSKSIAVEMTKYGAPLVIASFASWILSLSDRYIINLYRGNYEVGLYSASYTLAEQAIYMICDLFILAAFPLIVSLWEKEGREATQDYVGNLTRYYLLFSFPAALGLSVLSKPTIMVFTTSAYYEGHKIIPLISFGVFLLGLQLWNIIWLILYKKTNIAMYSVLSVGFLNIGLNFLLVPKYGYMASAVATFISYACLLLVMVIISKKFFVWKFPFKSLGRIICASSLMGIIVYYIINKIAFSPLIKLLLGVCLGVLLYLGMLILLKELRWSEIRKFLLPWLKGEE